MYKEIKEKLDEWFCGPEPEEVDYDVLHYWITSTGAHHIVCLHYGTLYFMRAWNMSGRVEISRDGVERIYHHDDYEIVDGLKFVCLAGERK